MIVPQPAATTFTFSSVFLLDIHILYLYFHFYLFFLPVVYAAGAVAVVGSRAAESPLAATVVLAGPVAFTAAKKRRHLKYF